MRYKNPLHPHTKKPSSIKHKASHLSKARESLEFQTKSRYTLNSLLIPITFYHFTSYSLIQIYTLLVDHSIQLTIIMADEREIVNVNEQAPVESTDRGLFDFLKKKEGDQKPQEEAVIASEFEEKVQVSEAEYRKEEAPKEEEKKHDSLLEKLHRSDSSSSSSSDEEGDDEEKKKRRKEKKEKKGLKEKIKEKLPGHKDHEEDTSVPIEKCEEKIHVQEVVYSEPSHPAPHQEENKGFLDKIKDKLPGQHKKAEEHHEVATPVVAAEPCVEGEKDKKGFLDKIKDKIPGFHSKNDEEIKKESQ